MVLIILESVSRRLVDMSFPILLIILALLGIRIGLFKITIYLGYTIEAGFGENPLPISQFNEIYRDNLGILLLGAVLG